jgi:hypothetical protein
MRELLESLCPETRHIYWIWVATMFVFYVAALASVAAFLIGHQGSAKPAQENATSVRVKPRVATSPLMVMPVARFDRGQ